MSIYIHVYNICIYNIHNIQYTHIYIETQCEQTLGSNFWSSYIFINEQSELDFIVLSSIPCRTCHGQAKSVIKTTQFIRSKELVVDINLFFIFMEFLHHQSL